MIDYQYLNRVSHKLDKFQKVGKDRFRCRCPYCGDSKKDPNKARGNFFPSRDDPRRITFTCFNCSVHRTFKRFLRELDAGIYREYQVESLKSSGSTSTVSRDNVLHPDFWNVRREDKVMARAVVAQPETFFTPMTALHDTHPAKAYLRGRLIPEDRMALLYYTDEWKAVTRQFQPDKYEGFTRDESRIVIPIMSPDGTHFVGYQGRAMDPSATTRYKMIMVEEGASRVFGQERIDTTLPVLAVEGPFDSLFLENCVALCGAQNTERLPYRPHYLLDQEPRNPHVVARIKKLLELGESVCFLPDRFQETDINEIVIATGMGRRELTDMVLAGSTRGPRGLLKLGSWKRTDGPADHRKRLSQGREPTSGGDHSLE